MNKDLDDRLIPSGEYRDAQNISVGKSEADDIGALENVLGNTEITVTNLAATPILATNMKSIGYITDENKGVVYVFTTNYTDPNGSSPVQPSYINGTGSRCIIYSWNLSSPTVLTRLVDDIFLNFSTTNPIQASIIENLLFFTDNRNQPRKINITKPLGYYTDESQVSVAKYSPYQAISLVKKTTATVLAAPAPTSTTFVVKKNLAILPGMSISSTNANDQTKIQGGEYITVLSAVTSGAAPNEITTVTLSAAPAAAGNNPSSTDIFLFLISTMTDKSDIATWPGDPDYLEDRFVRFSYRFQYDDGEYSLMAPFTQITYLPKQKGYFFGNGQSGADFKPSDENAAYRSTIVEFMENSINNIELRIPLPEVFTNSNVSFNYKIKNLEVLYKESDALVVKVLDTLNVSQIVNTSETDTNTCVYDYQSRKPYKTLTEEQTVRVYDKVPVRALAQETVASRVIYGNYTDRYTPPNDLFYEVKIQSKDTINFENWIEYPNHTLKQNRNYQVGFVLADKFGRQSPVILSPVDEQITVSYSGSTIYSPYDSGASNIKEWFGDALQLTINETIQGGTTGTTSLPNFQTGTPGLYGIRTGNGSGFDIAGATATVANKIYTFTTTASSVTNVPIVGNYLRGEYIDFVKITNRTGTNPYTITCDGDVNKDYEQTQPTGQSDIKYGYKLNQTGWYSYKIVVKQTEQDYYNVYLPGILNGYPARELTVPVSPLPNPFNIPSPTFPTDEDGKTANIVLINDNINKIPRDLSEVGPEQKQFRSSVQLFGRVENDAANSNRQYYPLLTTDTAINISTADDSNMVYQTLSTVGQANLYQLDTNPLIARLSTTNAIGSLSATMQPYLAIYETEPVESLLDIFWETASEGLVADLNSDIDTGFTGASSLTATGFNINESKVTTDIVTDPFWPVSQEGNAFDSSTAYSYIGSVQPTSNINIIPQTDSTSGLINWSVSSNREGTLNSLTNASDASSKFVLEYNNTVGSGNRYSYQLKLNYATVTDNFIYLFGSAEEEFTFIFNMTTVSGATTNVRVPINLLGDVTNITPDLKAALTNIFADVTEGPSAVNPLVDYSTLAVTPGVNGTSNSVKTNDLFYDITAGNPSGYFAITQAGQLYQAGGAESIPYGVYTLTIKLRDATVGPGAGTEDTGFKEITRQQIIQIGPQPINLTLIECITNPSPNFGQTSSNPKNQFTSPNTADPAYYNSPTAGIDKSVSGIWYISSSSYTSYGTATGGINQGLSAGDQIPVSGMPLATENGGKPWRLAEQSLTGGSVVFSCNLSQDNTHSNSPNGYMTQLQSTAQFRVYHRTTSGTGAWRQIKDVNNNPSDTQITAQDYYVPADRGTGPSSNPSYVINTKLLSVNNQPFTSYAQIIFAFDQPGEYAVLFDEGSTITGDEAANRMVAWCNADDLYYDKCVIENGVNTTLVNGVATPQAYEYSVQGNPGSSTPGCSFALNSVNSPVAYGEYVEQFFTSPTFGEAFSFSTIGGTPSSDTNYYAFRNETVFRDASISSSPLFTFSSRFTTATGKKFKPAVDVSCWAKYKSGNPNNCTINCDPVIRKFPYGLNS